MKVLFIYLIYQILYLKLKKWLNRSEINKCLCGERKNMKEKVDQINNYYCFNYPHFEYELLRMASLLIVSLFRTTGVIKETHNK